MGSILTFADIRKQFPIGATFTADFLSGNAARAGEANQHRRREVLTVTRRRMEVRYLTGPRRGETSVVTLDGHTVRLDNHRGVECLVFADDRGTDWYRVTHIMPRGVDASLEWHKNFIG